MSAATRAYDRVLEAARLLSSANVTSLLVNHLTKRNELAGPRTLEHGVDCVLMLRKTPSCRLLFTLKNRHGPASMVGHVGFIEELHPNGRALVRTVTINAQHHRLAFMSTKALEPVNDPVWAKAMAQYRRQQQQAEYEAFCQRLVRQQQIEMIADKYQITVDAALEIATVVTGEDVRRIYY